MKKIFLMLVAIIGFAIAANAQADQCKLEGGNKGYISAYVSSTHGMGDQTHSIAITTTPSVDQPSDGKVLCKITYTRKDNGQDETVQRLIEFKKSGSHSNNVKLDSPASRIKSVEIWGAECKSASRSW